SCAAPHSNAAIQAVRLPFVHRSPSFCGKWRPKFRKKFKNFPQTVGFRGSRSRVFNWGAYALSRAGDGASPSRSFEEKFHVAVFFGFGVFPFGNFFVELLASGLSG